MMRFFSAVLFVLLSLAAAGQSSFVTRKGSQFRLNGQPYYYLGTNYWYGSILPLEKDPARGIDRLRRELDFLQARGIRNIRVMGGAEGSGLVNGVVRVGPPLQPQKGIFDTAVLNGLDLLLYEMGKRNMKAVIFFSNNWEWSGGFLQYLNWNGQLPDSVFRRTMSWDELRDQVSRFYTCTPCKEDYLKQVDLLLDRVNRKTGKRYVNDPAIMAWELANEPRPMRPAASAAYLDWTRSVAAHIKSKDRNHLLTTGHEGWIGTEGLPLFEAVHADPNIDYLAIHIWPRNWGWYDRAQIKEGLSGVLAKTGNYIDTHMTVARRLNKPLVIEEFGFPRDDNRFDPASPTTLRDQYYSFVYTHWLLSLTEGGPLAGVNFWAFNGRARPVPGQAFWKPGDEYMGDPPMEEQGLYGVFDSDASTWKTIGAFGRAQKGGK